VHNNHKGSSSYYNASYHRASHHTGHDDNGDDDHSIQICGDSPSARRKEEEASYLDQEDGLGPSPPTVVFLR